AAHRTLLTILDEQCPAAADESQRFDLALTGGSDALRMMDDMASDPLVDAIDWRLVHFWWADERFVGRNDPDRNALQARTRLLDHLCDKHGLPDTNIHEMPADTRDPREADSADEETTRDVLDKAALSYENELRHELGDAPRMDLLILGMGPDGHYASLFPGHPQIAIRDRLVVGVDHSPKPPARRLSMTVPVLSRSERSWMLTAGEGKIDALARALRHPNDPDTPASFTTGASQTLWMTTRATALL
ncbi:6-phosphogluconolactonase, partial [uncultured Bifidobacterium sp.]|uniref:6-phosphogluconolactonase n=1 Tax=uncultured Bifidobacterium sp. TaxID=165187 RepID=UPI00345B0807